MPEIFRGIDLNPLTPGNTSYLLWMIMGFLIVTAVLGTVWAYLKLEDRSPRRPARIDWAGNLTFALGLIAVMVGITTGIRPAGGHTMGWTSPRVIAEIGGGIALLVAFVVLESCVA